MRGYAKFGEGVVRDIDCSTSESHVIFDRTRLVRL